MKKIVVLSNMYPSKEHPTFGIFVKNQVMQLQKSGLDLEVIAITEARKGKFLTIKKYLKWFFQSFIYLLNHKSSISLTHAHYAFPTGFLSLIGKKLFKIPYVVTIHGGDIDKMAKKNIRIQKLTKKILNEASKVITVGERLKKEVVENFGVQEERVTVLSMGVDRTVFQPKDKKEVRETLGIEIEQDIILFVGNIIREKGLVELIQAFQQLRNKGLDVKLYLIGASRDRHFKEELMALIEEEHAESIIFYGAVNQEELANWMAASNVLALPSYHEGFGLVALEAMATNTTVVASNVGGLTYLLANQAGILVEPKNVEALANGLEKGLKHIDFNEDKRNEVVKLHSTSTILEELHAIYYKTEKRLK